jgi:hypothetical protein
MITGENNLIEWLKFNNCPFWRLSTGEKGNIIAAYWDTDQSNSLADGIVKFQQTAKMLNPGTYFVSARYKGLNDNSLFKTHFILQKDGQIGGFSPMQQSVLSNEDIDSKIAGAVMKAQEDWRKEQLINEQAKQIDELKKKNKELDDELGSFNIGRIFTRIEPFLPHITKALNLDAVAPAVGGPIKPQQNNTAPTANDQERLENAIETIAKNDDMVVDTMEAIARLAKDKPEEFETYRNMLINM